MRRLSDKNGVALKGDHLYHIWSAKREPGDNPAFKILLEKIWKEFGLVS
jgi:hypothetical protein